MPLGFQILFSQQGNQARRRTVSSGTPSTSAGGFCRGLKQPVRSETPLAGEIASKSPICQGGGCLGAAPASARNTPEVLVRVMSRDDATDIRMSQKQVAEARA